MNKKVLLIGLMCICAVQLIQAQHFIYVKADTVIKTKIVMISPDSTYYGLDSLFKKIPNKDINLVFDDKGNYLTRQDLLSDDDSVRTFVSLFVKQMLPSSTDSLDYVILKNYSFVKGKITASDSSTVYVAEANKNVSLDKKEILAVIYLDGKHQFFQPSAQIAPALIDIRLAQSNAKPKITTKHYEQFRKNALSKVEDFGIYLQTIADKEATTEEKDKVIEQACSLFSENALIEVSSKTGKTTYYPIKDYLTRLKLLPQYGQVSIEWTDIQYVENLQQSGDGNYYGTITGEQRFTGYAKNGTVKYSDITKKEVKVQLRAYSKIIDGKARDNWEVLLGNIGVVSTR